MATRIIGTTLTVQYERVAHLIRVFRSPHYKCKKIFVDTGKMMTRKNVTWSPVVTPVSRPTSIAKKVRRRRSVMTFEHDGDTRRVQGHIVAHSRRDTRTTLLTIRNKHHRDMQLLIDLPARCVRKIYNGESSYTVDEDASESMLIRFEQFGTIVWKDDNDTVRRPDARGFSLEWLKDKKEWPIRHNTKTSRRKCSKMRRSKSGRRSTRRRKR